MDVICFMKKTKPHRDDEAPTIVQTEVSPTLNTFDVGDIRTNIFIVQTVDSDDECQIPLFDL